MAVVLLGACAFTAAQTTKPKPAASAPPAAKALQLAQTGRCAEALPTLKRAASGQIDQEMKRSLGLATIRCGMTVDDRDAVVDAIKLLNRNFPTDPEVLYISTHAYSDLASRESLDLARKAPDSSQAHEMQAEALETQGKWDEAAKEYRLILDRSPDMPGIHFRLGRLLLSQPSPPADMAEQAQKEFEAELKINPNNAGAEYILGQLAQQSQSWDSAAEHYTRATKLDLQFGEAYLGLGVSLLSLKRYGDAIAPLELAVKLQPGNPDAHYRLATAYTRSGRKQEADQQFAIHSRLVGTQGGAATATTPTAQTPNDK